MEGQIVKLLKDLKINELKYELEKRGLEKTGLKGILMERLRKALQDQEEDPNTYNFYIEQEQENNEEEMAGGETGKETEETIQPKEQKEKLDHNIIEILRNLMEESRTKMERNIESNIQDNMKRIEENIKQEINQVNIDMRKSLEDIQARQVTLENRVSQNEDKIKEDENNIRRIDLKATNNTKDIQDVRVEMKEGIQVNIDIMEQENYKIRREVTNFVKESLEKQKEERKVSEKEVQQIKEKLEILQQKQEIPTFIREPIWGENDIFYYGDLKYHPMKYLKHIEESMKERNQLNIWKNYISRSLKGMAKAWYDVMEDHFLTWEQFKIEFQTYFWGDHIQDKIRENLYMGQYIENRGSREMYAMRKMDVAKQLQPKIPMKDIIKYISRHFSDEIREYVGMQAIHEEGQFLSYLRRVDGVKNQRWDGRHTDKSGSFYRDGGRTDFSGRDGSRASQNNGFEKGNNYQRSGYYNNQRQKQSTVNDWDRNRYENQRSRENSYNNSRSQNWNENRRPYVNNGQVKNDKYERTRMTEENRKEIEDRNTMKNENRNNRKWNSENVNAIEVVADIEPTSTLRTNF